MSKCKICGQIKRKYTSPKGTEYEVLLCVDVRNKPATKKVKG